MPSYSSDQFYKDWRYAIETEFTDPSGSPVKYAKDGFRTWGSEFAKIPFPESPNAISVNSDTTLLAIAYKENIHIYNTTNFDEIMIMKGHISSIDAIAFQPENPKVLVSASSGRRGIGRLPGDPIIYFWNLDEQVKHPMLDDRVIFKIASKATETAISNLRAADPDLTLSPEDEKSLVSAIEPSISNIVKTHSVINRKKLTGRLSTSFQAEIFSPSGSHLIYLPGKSPASNGNNVWDVRIYSMVNREDVFTLRGHTDSIMWTGYSPDENLIATVAWDQSIRIWSSTTGEQKFKFETSGQNWTGGFSSDSKRFAGTCGDGSLYVYSMIDGATLVHHKPETGRGWLRALSWSDKGDVLAVGGGHGGGAGAVFLYDVEKMEVVQQRILSTKACPVEPDIQRMMRTYLECNAVQFVDGGRKVVTLTSGDGGFETYDLESWEKWRFARPGVDPVSGSEGSKISEEKAGEEIEEGEKKKVVHGGYRMKVWEDHKRGKIFIASLDGDGTRIWDVPMTKVEDSEKI